MPRQYSSGKSSMVVFLARHAIGDWGDKPTDVPENMSTAWLMGFDC